MERIAKALSLTLSGVLIFLAATWPLHADMTDGAMAFARNIIPPNIQTSSYPINLTDCFRPMIQYGTGATGQKTATLPPVGAFPVGCRIRVKNGDVYTGDNTGRGVKLSGFPSDLPAVLYPNQILEVIASPSGFQTSVPPGRWRMPQTVTFHVDTGGNNANDGLASGSTNALATAQQAYINSYLGADLNGTTPIIAMACSQTHTTNLQMGGVPIGSNLIQLSPDGNCTFTWTNAGSCIVISDGAELDLRLNQYGSSGGVTLGCNTGNTGSTAQIYMHNQTVVLDLEGGPPIWNPAGANDEFMFCDGYCQYTIANGVTQATAVGANYMIHMSAGGHGTWSGAVTASGSGGLAGGIMYLFGGAMVNLGVSGLTGWSPTPGASKVWANATIVTNGITPPGGYSVGASAAACTALTGPTC